jgi:hypothetical protein
MSDPPAPQEIPTPPAAPTPPIDQERFDSLMKLADFRRQVREERRQLEWKLSLALWAAMAARDECIPRPTVSNCALGIGLVLVVGAHIAFWVEASYLRNERDAKQMYDHLDPAQRMLPLRRKHGDKHLEEIVWYGWITNADGTVIAEVLTTMLLAAFWYFIIMSRTGLAFLTRVGGNPSRTPIPPK